VVYLGIISPSGQLVNVLFMYLVEERTYGCICLLVV